MKSILICNQKGGVGKTMISDEIAFALDRDGIPFNFYDLDEQGSAIHTTDTNPDAEISVIDTPGYLQDNLIEWIDKADFVIIPTLMSTRDIGPLERMIKILKPYMDKKPVLFIFNRWNRFNVSKDFISWFEAEYPNLRTFTICDSVIFNFAAAHGKSVCECKPESQAATQIDNLYNCIRYELNLKTGRRE